MHFIDFLNNIDTSMLDEHLKPKEEDDRKIVDDAMDRLVNSFPEEYLGRYVLTMKSRSDRLPVLYLVDRHVCDKCWWSPDASLAYVIVDPKHAEDLLKTYNKGDVTVKEITRDMTVHGRKREVDITWG